MLNSKLVYAESTPNTIKMGELIDFTSLPELRKMVEVARKRAQQKPKDKKAKAAEKKLRELSAEREATKARILAKAQAKIQQIKDNAKERRANCIEPRVQAIKRNGKLESWSTTCRIAGWPLSKSFSVKKYGEEHAELFAETAKIIFLHYIDVYCRNRFESDLAFTQRVWEMASRIPYDALLKPQSPRVQRTEHLVIEKSEVIQFFSARWVEIPRTSIVLLVKAIEGMSEMEKLEFVHYFSKTKNITSYRFNSMIKSSVNKEYLIIDIVGDE